MIKKYFDQYRGTLPPELEGEVEGLLMPDVELMNKWRNWRTGLEYHDKELDAVLFGALDDCLLEGDPSTESGHIRYIPLDYKTRGSSPKDGDSEKYYQTQLDSYSLLLSTNGYQTTDYAYLVYYYPEEVKEDGMVKFNIKPVKVHINLERAESTFRDAVKLLKGPIPERYGGCEYCRFTNDRIGFV